jgi:hypothetical protein
MSTLFTKTFHFLIFCLHECIPDTSKIHPYHIFSIYDKVAIFLLPCPSLLHFMPIYRQRTRAVRTRKLKPPLWNVGRIPYQ